MDGIHPHFTARTFFSFLFLILLQTTTANICSAPQIVSFQENNAVGDVVQTITVKPGVTLDFKPPPANPDNPFSLLGNNLIAERVLDYELGLSIVVVVTNVNDNPPVFDLNLYRVDANEMSPVDMSVGRFPATDLDSPTLYYTLTSESDGFKLRSPINPVLLVKTPLDYERVKTVQLILSVQDTPLTPANSRVSYSATTTIVVTILDVDNRPPWFQPCSRHEIGGAVVCQSAGYTGRVVLNEQEIGVLPLEPGPLHAIDGDSGIDEKMTYSFLNGNADGLFEINANTGNITMLKPADVLGTISLTVLAAQEINSYQFATTTVTVSVQVKSLHHPQFQKSQYEGVITAVGMMAMDPKNMDEPLQILATDDDYAATGGINPLITYYVNGSSDFSVVGSYLFMTKDLPEGTLSLQVVATDESNEESATAQLSVEVASGLTTTSLPLSTTGSIDTTPLGESTTNGKTTEDIVSTTNPTTSTDSSLSTTTPGMTTESIISTTNPSMTSEGSVSTTKPSVTSEGSISTTNPSMTSEGSISTTKPSLTSEGSISTTNPSLTSDGTAHPHTVIVPSGGYGLVDMAVLGATLGVLLLICLVVIGVLAFCIRRGNADWRKIYEASMFQSSLAQGSQKEGIQYTNEAFQNDDDGGSTVSGGPVGGSVMAGRAAVDLPLNKVIAQSLGPLHALLHDDTSLAGSDKADNEKEVKPILTKERRMDEGYKSVWFKEDIDPDAKEEVVIIPDSREDDSEEEDEEPSSSGREDDEDDNPRIKTQKVVFNDADLDSGLGVKMEDPAEDSEGDEVLTVDL
ncbi:cadherin-related family member 5 [Sebastes umbrosus]|uniref:cadherin-related family member 5 n=1 Tax=Sebastes umbrosus TaxID=72105 RepID=UPI0018A0C698|nr:cadherin-related family member 5 [Sebastes umbrosus]